MEVYWQYFIIDEREDFSNYQIISEGKEVLFEYPESVVLTNGQKAFRISSSSPQLVKNEYDFSLTLTYNYGDVNATILLPFPTSNSPLMLDDSGNQNAELYIYL